MTLLSRSIELLLERDASQVPAKLASLRDLQKDALAEMRALIFELRPGNVEESGLIGALRRTPRGLPAGSACRSCWTPTSNAAADRGRGDALPDRPGGTPQHGQARRRPPGHDRGLPRRGRGPPEGRRRRARVRPSQVPDGHLGLAGMRARAEKLGGRIAVKSTLGHGTSIEVVVPEVVAPPS